MASLETHYGSYRIVLRFGGKKFCRSLKTDNSRTANAALARVDENLSRLETGQLRLPAGADLVTFLLSDGRLEQRPVFKPDSYPYRAQSFARADEFHAACRHGPCPIAKRLAVSS